MAPSPGVEPGRASFGGSTLIPSGRRCAGLLARNRTWTTGFVDRCVVPPRRGAGEDGVSEEERGLEPHTPSEVRLAFEASPAPSRFSFRVAGQRGPARGGIAWWSVRESNPLREAFQASALPIELTDRERKAEDSNLTRTISARIAFQTISAPGGFAFRVSMFNRRVVRTAGFEPAVSSPPDWRFCRAKLRPERPGHTWLGMPRRGRRGQGRSLHEGGPRE